MTISKVKSVTGNGSFENDFGALQDSGKKLLFSFEYEMEDGTIIKANHKTSTSPFAIGSEVEYEVKKEHPEHGKSGSVKKPDTGNYSGSNASKGGSGSNRSFALSYAKDVLVASYITNNPEALTLSTDQMFALAEKMNKWLDQKEPEVQEVVQSAADILMDDSQN